MNTSLVVNQYSVQIQTNTVTLAGDLNIPERSRGVVLFAHGSGSSRFSQRNRFVADVLIQARLATLLFDLLTAKEEKVDQVTGELRFDIDLLSDRLIDTVDWLAEQETVSYLPMGLFGSSTGAAAALNTAAARPQAIRAAVSRGGRPDLAAAALPTVQCPVLLIIGGNDPTVIELNQQAATALSAPHTIMIIPGATHLFVEPGTLKHVAELARDWFLEHLTGK